mmetsp:Transcript_42734/g.70519  ORF Transcript_42734/g.70519 Transcript_42734/m.70519 type:complete len:200 (+) Transcript_42734:177-776(+)
MIGAAIPRICGGIIGLATPAAVRWRLRRLTCSRSTSVGTLESGRIVPRWVCRFVLKVWACSMSGTTTLKKFVAVTATALLCIRRFLLLKRPLVYPRRDRPTCPRKYQANNRHRHRLPLPLCNPLSRPARLHRNRRCSPDRPRGRQYNRLHRRRKHRSPPRACRRVQHPWQLSSQHKHLCRLQTILSYLLRAIMSCRPRL